MTNEEISAAIEKIHGRPRPERYAETVRRIVDDARSMAYQIFGEWERGAITGKRLKEYQKPDWEENADAWPIYSASEITYDTQLLPSKSYDMTEEEKDVEAEMAHLWASVYFATLHGLLCDHQRLIVTPPPFSPLDFRTL